MVRKYKPKSVTERKRPLPQQYTAQDIDNALKAVRAGTHSLRLAEAEFRVPRATLCRRLKLEGSSKKPGHPTVFSEEEETALVDHCIEAQVFFFI